MTVDVMPTPAETQEPTVKDQAARVLAHIAGYAGTRTIELGLAHGLIETLARHPDGLTIEALATEAGLDRFNVEVWSRAGVAHDLLERTADGGVRLAPHLDTVLLDRGSAAYVAGTLNVMVQAEVFDRFGATFASGERTWWDQCSPAFIDGVSGSGGAFYARLIPDGLRVIPGLGERLGAGARVLEVACGTGVGLVRLAEAFPGATIVGADGDAFSLTLAADRLREHGLADRVELVHTPLEDLDRVREFDLVVSNISMHECRDLDRVTEHVKRALRPDGTVVISDFAFPDTDEGLRTVPGRIMSGIQFFEAGIDDQLLPPSAYVELLARHGFRDIGTFALAPIHAVVHAQR